MAQLFREILAVATGLGLLLYIPVNTRRIEEGWVPARFTGSMSEYRAVYAKQARRFAWLATGIGIVFLALIPGGEGPADWGFDLLVAAIWFGIAAMVLHSRRQLRP